MSAVIVTVIWRGLLAMGHLSVPKGRKSVYSAVMAKPTQKTKSFTAATESEARRIFEKWEVATPGVSIVSEKVVSSKGLDGTTSEGKRLISIVVAYEE